MDIKKEMLNYLEKFKAYARNNAKALRIAIILLVVMWLTSKVKGCIADIEASRVYPRPVHTAVSSTMDVPVYLESFGTLTSPEDVDIKAQVTGKILEVHFTQGDEVAAGDLLFTIDPKEYAAEVSKAEAAYRESSAQARLKEDLLERNKALFEKKLISDQAYEGYQTDSKAARAQAELDKAALDLARINLDYCSIRSPIDGIAGKRQVDIGNIVSANTGPTLVNIKSIGRLYIDFTLPEGAIDNVRQAMKQGALEVDIFGQEDGKNGHSGKLDFIDNTVDETTGTFSLRATVDNADKALWSGQFVKVRLLLRMEKGVVVVPFKAAQMGKQGYFVFTVDKHGRARLNPVKTGEKYNDDIVIEQGLDAGETVVTLGQLALRPGAKVIDVEKLPKNLRPPRVDKDSAGN